MPGSQWKITTRIARRSFVKNLLSFSAIMWCNLNGLFDRTFHTPSTSQVPVEDVSPGNASADEKKRASDNENDELDVVIIGAGIAGLSAAYYLQDLNIRILEKTDRAGGRTVSGKHGKFTYARGTEYLGYPEGALKDIVRALNLDVVEIPSPMDAHFDGKDFYYGSEGLAIMHIQNSSIDDINNFMARVLEVYDEYDEAPGFDPANDYAWLDDITARAWFEENEFAVSLMQSYHGAARGLFGANLDEISALSYIPEIAFDFEDEAPIEDLDELENTPQQAGEHSEAYSFVTGITEVTDALASQLKGVIQYRATVQSVTNQDRHYVITYLDSKGKTQTLVSKCVLLATPAPVTSKIASRVLDKEQKEIIDQIAYSVYATVSLFCRQPVFDRAFDLSVPHDYFFSDIYDSTWMQRHLDKSLRNTEEYILTVYVPPFSYRDSSLLALDDDDLLEKIYTDLENIFPQIRKAVSGYDILRFEYAYPVMTPGAYRRLARLHEITENEIQLAGDYMIYPTFEAAADSGKLAAIKVRNSL